MKSAMKWMVVPYSSETTATNSSSNLNTDGMTNLDMALTEILHSEPSSTEEKIQKYNQLLNKKIKEEQVHPIIPATTETKTENIFAPISNNLSDKKSILISDLNDEQIKNKNTSSIQKEQRSSSRPPPSLNQAIVYPSKNKKNKNDISMMDIDEEDEEEEDEYNDDDDDDADDDDQYDEEEDDNDMDDQNYHYNIHPIKLAKSLQQLRQLRLHHLFSNKNNKKRKPRGKLESLHNSIVDTTDQKLRTRAKHKELKTFQKKKRNQLINDTRGISNLNISIKDWIPIK